ncbi:MAG TPA: hypothetical protein VN923_19170, partial [Thermoanaerobaculia bacterium]|nr:hypothetical protein [Thermoanaerobaculia bacterium]
MKRVTPVTPEGAAPAAVVATTVDPTHEAPAAAELREHAPVEVRVSDLLGDELSDLRFRVLAGEGKLDNQVENPRVQKPGLAFAGYYPYIKPGRVQIIGESETAYLQTLSAGKRQERFERISRLPVPVFILTKGLEPLPDLLAVLQQRSVPLLASPALSSVIIKRVSWYLEDHLVPTAHLHGVLLDVYGLGVLLIGKSGVGKSESALDLITRGHSLVADDRVTVKRYPSGDVVGYSETPLRHHMELRGIGIINVKDLFGLA